MKQQALVVQAVRPANEQLAAALPEQSHMSADETPTKQAAVKSWLWTFVTDRFTVFAVRPSRRNEVAANLLTEDFGGMEPTNNASECSLRHSVICRKLSFGTQSAGGSRFVETLLTVIESCRQQGRDVFAWVTAAVQSRFAGQPCPSLLPGV
ncbi:MAG: transposase [Planctomycetaceae bacterium]|nr:transposase [Planctomycetaceae bacterium]